MYFLINGNILIKYFIKIFLYITIMLLPMKNGRRN